MPCGTAARTLHALDTAAMSQFFVRAVGITDRVGGPDRSVHDPAIYPIGWTGRVGVWRTSFSGATSREFGAGLRGFEAAGPRGGPIAGLYPDLVTAAAPAESTPGAGREEPPANGRFCLTLPRPGPILPA